MTGRLETLGSLLSAMAIVALTGELPPIPNTAPLGASFDLGAKPKIIVPLRQRFSGLFIYSRFGHFRGCHPAFNAQAFLRETFGLNWQGCYVRDLLDARVMPSSVQIAIAMHMANGDTDRAAVLLAHRGGKGVNEARHAAATRLRAGCLPSVLWRYPGNADELWYGLRDAMSTVVKELPGGAL